MLRKTISSTYSQVFHYRSPSIHSREWIYRCAPHSPRNVPDTGVELLNRYRIQESTRYVAPPQFHAGRRYRRTFNLCGRFQSRILAQLRMRVSLHGEAIQFVFRLLDDYPYRYVIRFIPLCSKYQERAQSYQLENRYMCSKGTIANTYRVQRTYDV